MLFNKLLSNKLSLEYTKAELLLILVSGVVLIVLNFYMITELKPNHNAKHHVENVSLSR